MKPSTLSRKAFLQNSVVGLSGLSLVPSPSAQFSEKEIIWNTPTVAARHYTLKNVRLETGFDYESEEVVGTKTGLFSVEIENGKIKNVSTQKSPADAIDAKGLLMLPSFKDMHIHLDKTFYGDKWQATKRRTNGVKGMIALEQQLSLIHI